MARRKDLDTDENKKDKTSEDPQTDGILGNVKPLFRRRRVRVDPTPAAPPTEAVTREDGENLAVTSEAASAPDLKSPGPDKRRTSRSPRSRKKPVDGAPAERKTRAARSDDATTPAPVIYEARRDEFDLPIPIWRPLGGSRGPSAERSEALARGEAAEDTHAEKPVEKRGRRRTRAAPADERPEPQPQPPAPTRELVPIPPEAPQIVLRSGIPTLVRNGRVYPPLAFFGNVSDERRASTVFDEMRLAGEAGVHIHSVLVDLEVQPSSVGAASSLAAYLLKKALEADTDAQVVFRVVFQAARGWMRQFPEAAWTTVQGEHAEPSVCDESFWGTAKECLRSFVGALMMLPMRDHILGVQLERGEWFLPDGIGYDNSRAARAKFQEWCRARYLNDVVALRASWFDGEATFESIQVPKYAPEGSEGDRFVRSSRKQRKYVDYHLFLSDVTHERVAGLALATKEASEGWFLVGVSYGYTFEWSHPHSGHLSLGKVLRTPEIDFVAGPPSYRNREPGGSAPFPCPIDSFALNGKLYLSEEDFKTSIGGALEPDDFNPIIKTPQALESIHWRGVGAALVHGSGATWMDLWGNGWLKTASIWQRGAKAREALARRMAAPLSDPDVAVFIDERALAYLVDPNAFKLLVQNVREAVLRSGLSSGFYLLSDLQHRERFPEAKLYLFLNAWDIRPELRSAIKSRLQRDNKVLFWLYSAGLFDAGRDSLERAREVTGIAIKPQPYHSRAGTTLLNRRHPLAEAFADKGMIGGSQLEPSYFAINEEAIVLGEYSQTGLPSFLVKEFHSPEDPSLAWTSVFLGEPVVNPALIRALGQMAHAHIWNFQDDVVHVGRPFLTVHCTGPGPRTLTLPTKCSAYNVLNGEWAASDATNLRFNGTDGSTHLFLVGAPAELEQILSADLTSMLRMEQLPPRTENTVPFDAYSFDVPIMKLGEWIEGGVDEDSAEDWLLRPPPIEEEPEPTRDERPGRRRRRRRGRAPQRGAEQGDIRREGADVQAFDDVNVSVRFRKRGE